jgi:hypothetical protein
VAATAAAAAAVAATALVAAPLVSSSLSPALAAYLGADTLTARVAAHIPAARVYVPPEAVYMETADVARSQRAQESQPDSFAPSLKFAAAAASPAAASAAAGSAAAGSAAASNPFAATAARRGQTKDQTQGPTKGQVKGQARQQPATVGLRNASQWLLASAAAQRRAITATAEACPVRAAFVRQPLNEEQAKTGSPEPQFQARPTCAHALVASEVRASREGEIAR